MVRAETLSIDPEAPSGEYVLWEISDKNVSIRVHGDVVDRLSTAIMRGLGAIPRRGAEVGGVLLGRAVLSEKLVVTVDDFEVVSCSYSRGPSFLLSPEEEAQFRETVAQWAPAPDRPVYAVGFFRSHTREGLRLSQEDLDLFNALFPRPTDIILLVKPALGKPGVAGFFFREAGGVVRTESPYMEFPFQRSGSGDVSSQSKDREEDSAIHVADPETAAASASAFSTASQETPEAETLVTPPKLKRGNVWIPLSFLFLVLGICLGMSIGHLVGIIQRSQEASGGGDPYMLSLSAEKAGDAVRVKWNGRAPAIRRARRAVLQIQDGNYSNSVAIEPQDLPGGSLFYKNLTGEVHFKLEVFVDERASVGESIEYKEYKADAPPRDSNPAQ